MKVSSSIFKTNPMVTSSRQSVLAALLTLLCFTLASCSGGGSNNNPPTPDTTPPTAPTNVVATATSPTQINLTWTASTDNVGVTGYQVLRCAGSGCHAFSSIASPTTTSFSDTGLTPSTSYSYTVIAHDAAGNNSNSSTAATTSTQADTTPPTVPMNVVASAISPTQINLTWTASTDNVGVIAYLVLRCAGAGCNPSAPVSSPTTTSFNDMGLTPSTSYSYEVVATDAAGNNSNSSAVASATTPAASNITVSVSPRRGGLTLTQTLSVTATVTNDPSSMGVNWAASAGSFNPTSSASGTPVTYTAPSAGPGSVTITATSKADGTKSATATIGVTDLAGVFTYQNDNQRTGQNQQEYALTPSVVSAANFGKRFTCDTTEGGTVPGHIYAQPLYVANLTISGVKHNVFFVVTESDWVYAFDADASPCITLWKFSMLDAAHDPIPGETVVPPTEVGETGDLIPEIGITSTPVIDMTTSPPTLYVCAKSKESFFVHHHRLHALNSATGAEKSNSPVEITATNFDPRIHLQRPALLLTPANVFIAFGSHGDQNNYHGWLFGYNKTTLAQTSIWTATDVNSPTAEGAIWQSGAGPALDPNGNIWVEIANGNFDGTSNFGDSVVKLSSAATGIASFFTPKDQDTLRANDIDLGSGGVTILPDGFGSAAHPHLALATGKTNLLYLLDQNNLGGFNSSADNIVQEFALHNGLNESDVIGGMFSKAAYFNGRIYVVPIGDVFRAFSISNATLTALAPTGADTFGFPGATPSVSSQGASNGIVWALNTNNNSTPNGSGTSGPAILFAYDAATLTKLYSSPSSGSGAAVDAVKFVVPTIANGKVYVAGQGGVSVFGLLP